MNHMLKKMINILALLSILICLNACNEKFNGVSEYYGYCISNDSIFESIEVVLKKDSSYYLKTITLRSNENFKTSVPPDSNLKTFMERYNIYEIYWDSNELSFRMSFPSKSTQYNTWYIFKKHNLKDTITNHYYIKTNGNEKYLYAETY